MVLYSASGTNTERQRRHGGTGVNTTASFILSTSGLERQKSHHRRGFFIGGSAGGVRVPSNCATRPLRCRATNCTWSPQNPNIVDSSVIRITTCAWCSRLSLSAIRKSRCTRLWSWKRYVGVVSKQSSACFHVPKMICLRVCSKGPTDADISFLLSTSLTKQKTGLYNWKHVIPSICARGLIVKNFHDFSLYVAYPCQVF